MSTFPPELLAHLGGEATSVCHCWRVTREDGVVTGYSDHDGVVTFDGTEFRPQSGFSASEARETLGLATDTVDVEGVLSSDTLDADDLAAGKYDGANVETWLVNWRDTQQRALLRRAVIGRVTLEDGRFRAELESTKLHFNQPGGRWFRRACDAELGDARCQVDIGHSTLVGTGAVIDVLRSDAVRVSGLAGFADGWFSHGVLTCLDGPQAGTDFRVITHRRENGADELVIWRGSAPLPQAGVAVRVVAGCDKAFATCKAKFANHLNFQGFPHLPGDDEAYGYANEQQVFDGSPLVP